MRLRKKKKSLPIYYLAINTKLKFVREFFFAFNSLKRLIFKRERYIYLNIKISKYWLKRCLKLDLYS